MIKPTALEEFTDYFVRNYPGPHTVIGDPHWHAPRIFRAAEYAIRFATPDQSAPSVGDVEADIDLRISELEGDRRNFNFLSQADQRELDVLRRIRASLSPRGDDGLKARLLRRISGWQAHQPMYANPDGPEALARIERLEVGLSLSVRTIEIMADELEKAGGGRSKTADEVLSVTSALLASEQSPSIIRGGE